MASRRSTGRDAVTRVISTLLVLLGVAMLVRTIAGGGGPLASGVVLGLLFVAAGVGRLVVSVRGSG